MTPAPRGSGRRATLVLIGGSILFCLLLLGWLFPSLRHYRSHRVSLPDGGRGESGAPPPSATADPGGLSEPGAPGGSSAVSPGEAPRTAAPDEAEPSAASSASPALPLAAAMESETTGATSAEGLIVAEESEGGGRIRIEPAPFQPPPERAVTPPASPPPPPTPSPDASTPAVAVSSSLEPTPDGGAGSTEAGLGSVAEPGEAAPRLEPPVVLKAAWLRYPEDARRHKRVGTVEVRILVAETGGVRNVELVSGAGDTALDNAAVGAAWGTLFRPAHLGSEPVAVWYNYRFVFTVPDAH